MTELLSRFVPPAGVHSCRRRQRCVPALAASPVSSPTTEKRAARLRANSAAALGAMVSATTVASLTSWAISRRAPSKNPLPATSTSSNELMS